ncbi:DNA mismatch repair protein MutS [Oceanidesulfovibrio marinus]|uniref:DNA mismatch repair protein MutS n=1 Tax=Oceanidesulfovibrio marinus TaxID=370038 RepID=A0A6P1ZJL9_9BACT|nr:DNA mismatch repair protein MutS [Oceanidesulfovibrio marinus]TVM35010.1 DNA mismatch repair protein MutS [Oceanidesulfovibrio marinus]
MSAVKLTPMFEQYLGIKEEYPDALLFYRMGDFYELFFEDAEIAARELSIALTSRNPNDEARVPMCGVPHHAAKEYLGKLLQKGFKVAICDQIEDPKEAKGLVKRAVTRVLTPATVVDEDSLEAKDHNFLAALFWNSSKNRGGLGWLDYSTGDWSGFESARETELWQWAQKIGPRELLVAEGHEVPASLAQNFSQIVRLPGKGPFDGAAAEQRICKAQRVADLAVLDLAGKPELVRALGGLLFYCVQTQKHELEHLAPFKPLTLGKHLLLDEVTERNLELFRRLDGRTGPGTLLHVLDKTKTPMGGRLLRERLKHPWREAGPIEETLDAVAWFADDETLRAKVREALDAVYDLERCITRIFLGRATPKDFTALRSSIARLPGVRDLLEQQGQAAPPPKALAAILANWDDLSDFHALLEAALVDNPPPVITEGGLFRQGYKPELDELLNLTEHGESALDELLARERADTGLPKLKMGYNRVFGYFFELPRGQSGDAPERFVRRQTLANAERFTTDELKGLEEKLMNASEERKRFEYKLFLELRDQVAEARPRFLYMADVLAAVDYWQALAEAARVNSWTRPELTTGRELNISGGRHPVVEAVQGAANFIPNDLAMDEDRKILLITGPNMAGKSTVLRQAALILILAQMGSFVPASKATLGLADRIFSRVGASDNLAQGQSTFMVEMTETARILRQAGKRSLIILDEIGRGTSTFDGLALAWSVVEELAARGGDGMRTLFATHYHELTSLEGTIPGVRNLNIAVKEWGGDIVFLRRLVPGPSDRSYGIEVAKLAGVPPRVVQRAKAILAELEERAKRGESHRGAFTRIETCPTTLPGMDRPGHRNEIPEEPPGFEDIAPERAELLNQIAESLASVDLDALSPLEALNMLSSLKKRLEEN